MSNDIIPVDIDLIKRLRFEGKYTEATILLSQFRANNIRQKVVDASEYRRTVYLKEKAKGICTKCHKNKSITNKILCPVCNEANNKSSLKSHKSKVLK